ncbi:MAG: hypothetical protein HIU93_15385 [Acidobacteria bacterium]|nr:hypothetical protein [Acidobacteriota bacterium]MBW4046067.1 hypothetical protein [Acidobacteriota bacterium]
MSLIKKHDVKSYFSAQKNRNRHAATPATQPDATGDSSAATIENTPSTHKPLGAVIATTPQV